MPKIVNKDEKRLQIALSSLDIFYEQGLSKTTVSQIASAAGVGKGTVYLYFKSKEEIVIEIINYVIEKHIKHIEAVDQKSTTNRDKILHYFNFESFLEEDIRSKLLKLFQEYLGAILTSPAQMYVDKFHNIIGRDIEHISKYLSNGVVDGEFKEVNIETSAMLIASTTKGIITISKALNEDHFATQKKIQKSLILFLDLIRKD